MQIPKGSGNYKKEKRKIKGQITCPWTTAKRVALEKLKVGRDTNCPLKDRVGTHIE